MRPTPVLSAAAAVALLASVAGPATAAAPSPARGVASSSVTLLSVAAGGHSVSAGTLELLSDMLGAEAVAKILLTPLTADGTAYGQQTVTPGSSPASVPSVSTSTLVPALNGLIGLSSPVLDASATVTDGQPKTSAGAASLGGLSVLGLPVTIDGTLDVSSAVSRTAGAVGQKTVTVDGVALPSVAELLGALGLDLSALPIDVLTELLTALDLVNSTITDAQAALDAAVAQVQAQIDAAQLEVDAAAAALDAELQKLAGAESDLAAAEADLATKTAALNGAKAALADAQAQLTAANASLTKANADLDAALAAAGLASLDAYNALPPLLKEPLEPIIEPLILAVQTAQAAVDGATAAVTQATTDVANAQTLVDAAQAAVNLLNNLIATIQAAIDDLQALLDAALAALNSILQNVQAELDALLAAIMAVLNGTPLVSFDSLSVITEATSTSNTEGGQSAKVVGGEISGLRVLGTDVLSDVLGTTSIDLLDLTAAQLGLVNGLISDLTGTLSSVLSTVPAFPTLSIPAPEVGLLTKSASTDIVDGFGVASTSIKGLSITIPSVSIPTALALPGAESLPALGGITQVAGLLTSAPIKLDLLTLGANSRFAPAVAGTPATGTPTTGTPTTGTPTTGTPTTGTPGTAAPQLPRTGATQALAALGFALMIGAVVARRRQVEDLVG